MNKIGKKRSEIWQISNYVWPEIEVSAKFSWKINQTSLDPKSAFFSEFDGKWIISNQFWMKVDVFVKYCWKVDQTNFDQKKWIFCCCKSWWKMDQNVNGPFQTSFEWKLTFLNSVEKWTKQVLTQNLRFFSNIREKWTISNQFWMKINDFAKIS